LKLSTAKEKDIPYLVKVVCEWLVTMDHIINEEAITDDLLWHLKNGVVIFAKRNNELVGLMSGKVTYHFWVDQKIAHENWFFVRPTHQKTGVGKAMEALFSAWAKAMGSKRIIMTPNSFGSWHPVRAKEAFERYGYKVHGYQMMKDI